MRWMECSPVSLIYIKYTYIYYSFRLLPNTFAIIHVPSISLFAHSFSNYCECLTSISLVALKKSIYKSRWMDNTFPLHQPSRTPVREKKPFHTPVLTLQLDAVIFFYFFFFFSRKKRQRLKKEGFREVNHLFQRRREEKRLTRQFVRHLHGCEPAGGVWLTFTTSNQSMIGAPNRVAPHIKSCKPWICGLSVSPKAASLPLNINCTAPVS